MRRGELCSADGWEPPHWLMWGSAPKAGGEVTPVSKRSGIASLLDGVVAQILNFLSWNQQIIQICFQLTQDLCIYWKRNGFDIK